MRACVSAHTNLQALPRLLVGAGLLLAAQLGGSGLGFQAPLQCCRLCRGHVLLLRRPSLLDICGLHVIMHTTRLQHCPPSFVYKVSVRDLGACAGLLWTLMLLQAHGSSCCEQTSHTPAVLTAAAIQVTLLFVLQHIELR